MRQALVTAVASLLLAPSVEAAAPPLSPALLARWECLRQGPEPDLEGSELFGDVLGRHLWTEARAGRPLVAVLDAIAKRDGIAPEVAADLAEATLVTLGLDETDLERDPESADRAQVAEALWRAYHRAPSAALVLDQAAWILYELSADPAQDLRTLYELTRSDDPAPLVARLITERSLEWDLLAELVVLGLRSRPNHPALLLLGAQLAEYDPCRSAVFARQALVAAEAAETADATFRAAARNRLIAALLDAGLESEALEVLASVPPAALEETVLLHAPRYDSGRIAGLEYEVELVRLRLALVAANLLAGKPEEARRLAAELVAPAPADPSSRAAAEWAGLVRETIERLDPGPPPDSFDLLERALVAREESHEHQPAAISRLLARLARESFYSDIALSLLAGARPFKAPGGPAPVELSAAIDDCRAREAAADAALERELALLREAAGSSPDAPRDPAAALLARGLDAAPLRIFAERPLPAGIVAWEPPEEEREQLASALESVRPGGMWPVRIERDGAATIAIALSQDFDPAGEVAGGGYWIVRSSDGGLNWGRPLYTGLRPMQPYVIRSFSKLPLKAGERLQVEVEIRELDEEQITFPPTSRAFRREQAGLFLEAAWADLERDSDGDGLTDLAEERLMTDPRAADSDGDGAPDATDPLPHLARAGQPSVAGGALAAVLRHAGLGVMEPILTGDPGGQKPPASRLEEMREGAIAMTSQSTLFLVADRPTFGLLVPDRRIVVLTAPEEERARARFGPHFPGVLQLFLDHGGTRGLALWNESWRGRVLRLRYENGRWKVTVASSWIT